MKNPNGTYTYPELGLHGEYVYPLDRGTVVEVTARVAGLPADFGGDALGDELERHRPAPVLDFWLRGGDDHDALVFGAVIDIADAVEARKRAIRILGDALIASGLVSGWAGLPPPSRPDIALVASPALARDQSRLVGSGAWPPMFPKSSATPSARRSALTR